jgi:hypothetical protein
LPPVVTAGALTRTPRYAVSVGRGAFIALGATIPIATFADVVLTYAILLAWLLAFGFSQNPQAKPGNPNARVGGGVVGGHPVGAR